MIYALSISMLAACTSYQAHPVDLHETRTSFESRTLKDPSLDERLHRSLTAESYEMLRRDGWSVDDLLVAAAHFSPMLDEARAKLIAASAASITARARPNPTIGLSSEYDLSRADESPWLWGVAADFLLEGFARRIRMQLADATVRTARLEFSESIWSLRRDLRVDLLALTIAERRMAILSDALTDRQQLVQLLARRVAEGEAAMGERVQAELELSRLRAQMAQARQARQSARTQLAGAIGVPLAALDGERLRFDIQSTPSLPDTARISALRDIALLSRADLETAIIDYESRELELRREIRAQYPTFTVGPGYTYDHGVRKATLGASFSLPIFNRNRGPIAEAEARRTQSERHLLGVQATIFNEIEAARLAAAAEIETVSAARDELARANALVAAVERALAAGSEDRPTLLGARLAASNDELNLLDAIERAQTAVGHLEDALRTPFADAELKQPLKLE